MNPLSRGTGVKIRRFFAGRDLATEIGCQSAAAEDRSRLNWARCRVKSESRDHRSCTFLARRRDNGVVNVPTAFAQQARFQAAVARAAQRLTPHVVSVTPTLGNDWSGEPAVFFMVILADAASRRDQLLNISNQVEQAIVQEVQPLEQWGVLPYFNFRSQSEQAKLNQPALA